MLIPENEGDVACRSQLVDHRSVRRHVLDPPLQGDRAWPSGPSISALSWEPSWEPFSLDWCGRRWTPVEPEASSSSLYGHPWTSVDTAWRSTDQEVGCSSRPGRATENPCSSRGCCLCAPRRWDMAGQPLGAIHPIGLRRSGYQLLSGVHKHRPRDIRRPRTTSGNVTAVRSRL